MKRTLQSLLETALAQRHLPSEPVEVIVERTRDRRHGDYASNVALLLGKAAGTAPRVLAGRIVAALPVTDQVQRVEIAGPGFINFFLSAQCLHATLRRALAEANGFGTSRLGGGTPIQVEFVSANPTGPLHIGHGRGAAYGAVIANLLAAVGYAVHREYYVNDAGRQMDILALSVWLRYLERCGDRVPFPDRAYRGAYVRDIAAALHAAEGERLRRPVHAVLKGDVNDVPPDADAELDAAIASLKRALGTEDYRRLHDHGLNDILDGIRKDLADFGVDYQEWFSERSLSEDRSVERAIERLRALDRTYVKDGALWFNAVAYGDEKDRVLVRENGHSTYFASDVAYHINKLERGFERVIDIWGADHHGYAPRVEAALAALDCDPARLEVLLVQFATLTRGGERVPMSTRAGEFVTLRALYEETGRDAARFFYVMRRCEQHLEFDLDLAKSQSADNPVYYVQYAHARIASVFRQLAGRGLRWGPELGHAAADQLQAPEESQLMHRVIQYPDIVESAALAREPHQLAQFLRELANDLHVYYGAHPFLVEDDGLRNARLNLIAAVQQVLRNGLAILGVSAPEAM